MFVVYISRFAEFISGDVSDSTLHVSTQRMVHGPFAKFEDGEAFLAKQQGDEDFDDGEVLALMPPEFVVENAREVPAAFEPGSLGWHELNGTEPNLTIEERDALGYYAICAGNI
jgi:hypothetical protein